MNLEEEQLGKRKGLSGKRKRDVRKVGVNK
jgi:hypothetical protein